MIRRFGMLPHRPAPVCKGPAVGLSPKNPLRAEAKKGQNTLVEKVGSGNGVLVVQSLDVAH